MLMESLPAESSFCLTAHREEEVTTVVETALKDAGATKTGLSFDDFATALEGAELNMDVELPLAY